MTTIVNVDDDDDVVVDRVFRLYRKHGQNDYIGESVSITNHSIQAAMMAQTEGQDEEVIVAALFHDIGHLVGMASKLPQMDKWGTVDHDAVGGRFLRDEGFPSRVCRLVENHVMAKRYLVTTDADYYQSLSEASRQTLKFQGGKLTRDELIAYEADPLRKLYVKFRQWEEQAKDEIPESQLPDIDSFRPMVRRVLNCCEI